jgi:hypothetical protein
MIYSSPCCAGSRMRGSQGILFVQISKKIIKTSEKINNLLIMRRQQQAHYPLKSCCTAYPSKISKIGTGFDIL